MYLPSWESLDQRTIPTWFEDAKFGIFIHWGVYAVPAWRSIDLEKYGSYAEWYYARVMFNASTGGKAFHEKHFGAAFDYRDFVHQFKAELFNPDFYADLFCRAGAKYVVLTSKHHDGFCLWPSRNAYKKNWNAMEVGPKKDLVGSLTDAVKQAGLKMGLYYSIPEWESTPTHKTSSGYFLPHEIIKKYGIDPKTYVDEVLVPQLKELVECYRPSLLFADGGEWDMEEGFAQTKEFLSWLYNSSKVKDEIVVNDRFAVGMPGKHGDYFSSEYADANTSLFHKPWEESRGIGLSYGFNRAENLEHYQSTAALIHELIAVVSKGGNLLLNIGPAADGTIPVIMQDRLVGIGDWLKVNGEAIYGTRSVNTAFPVTENTFLTGKNNVVYVILTGWINQARVGLPAGKPPVAVSFLGDASCLVEWRLVNGELCMDLPLLTIDRLPCWHAWTLKVEF